MEYSEHYGLNLVEGSDTVNPMTVDKPNYEKIDETMYANECASVGTATELTTGTVHALTREKENQEVFRFRATSNYTVGDTFTVDGVVVSAQMSDGTTLADRCYIIGSDVLCALIGTQLTLFIPKKYDGDNVMVGNKSVTQKFTEDGNAITSLQTKVNGMKYTKFYTVEAQTNETWGAILARLRDEALTNLGGVAEYCHIDLNVDGYNGMVFQCQRSYSGARYSTWLCSRSSTSGIVFYSISISPTSTRFEKYAYTTGSGFVVTDLTDEVCSNVTVNGPDFNR